MKAIKQNQPPYNLFGLNASKSVGFLGIELK